MNLSLPERYVSSPDETRVHQTLVLCTFFRVLGVPLPAVHVVLESGEANPGSCPS